MKTSLWKVTTCIYDVPLALYFDNYYDASMYLLDCDNGETEEIILEHDEGLNYSEGCTWNELTYDGTIRTKDVSKRYGVIRYGAKVPMTYNHVCYTMGINPEVRFLKITNRGTLSYTCGKPDEIADLLREIEKNGYKPSRKLVSAVRI